MVTYSMGWPKTSKIGKLGVFIQFLRAIRYFILWDIFGVPSIVDYPRSLKTYPNPENVPFRDKWNRCWSVSGLSVVLDQVWKRGIWSKLEVN